MSHIAFTAPCICALSVAALSAAQPAATPPPNVVVMIADDISAEDFSAYGSAFAATKNIDALAARGLRFDRAILPASSCSPSRSSIITSRYPHNNGAACELHGPLPKDSLWLPSILRQAGYHTAISGKHHIGGNTDYTPEKYAEAFDVDDNRAKGNAFPESGSGNWVKILQNRPKNKPFFLWLASYDAHRSWDGKWSDAFGPQIAPEQVGVPQALRDNGLTRQDLASYYNEVRRFDARVGDVLAELEKQGVLDNTLILVMADNGRPFPRGKTRLIDDGMRTPFIVVWPNLPQKGAHTDALVSSIDFAPTVLELAGLPKPATFQGISFLPVLKDPKASVRDFAFSEHNWHDYGAFGRSVRWGDYLYILNKHTDSPWAGPADSVRSPSHRSLRALKNDGGPLNPAQADVFLCPRPAEELYLTSQDPAQLKNLVGDPAHAQALAFLRAAMAQWERETGDSFPAHLRGDLNDIETGKTLKGQGEPTGDYPGKAANAEKINAPGPVRTADVAVTPPGQ